MDKKYSKQEIYNKICEILEQEFEIDKSLLNYNAKLYEDLNLDSIDGVDLAVRLQQYTNKRFSPEEFKQIKTLNDIVNVVYDAL